MSYHEGTSMTSYVVIMTDFVLPTFKAVQKLMYSVIYFKFTGKQFITYSDTFYLVDISIS